MYEDRGRWNREHLVAALAEDPESFPMWGVMPAAWWQREMENLGVSGTSFLLIVMGARYEMLWQGMTWHSLTVVDLHSIRSKNLHELTGAGDDRRCTTGRTQAAVADELMNETKLVFNWLRQTSVCFMLKWDFFNLIFVFQFHSMWLACSVLWQLSSFECWFSCPIPQPKHATSSSSPPPLCFMQGTTGWAITES